MQKKGGPFYSHDVVQGNIGYKVDKDNEYVNFDTYLMDTDLMFLRLDWIEKEIDKNE